MQNKAISIEDSHESLHPYQLEVERIKNQLGNLDEIRTRLGLSRRQVCQLLLMDPSAWTRWSKSDAPPHVYQSLRWLLELKKINPDAAGPSNLHVRVDQVENLVASRVNNLERQFEQFERLLQHWSLTTSQNRSHESQLEKELSVLKAEFEKLQQKKTPTKTNKKKKKKLKAKSISKKSKKKKISSVKRKTHKKSRKVLKIKNRKKR